QGGDYVRVDITGDAEGFDPLGTSEGQGDGMVITALLAGQDTQSQTIYNGLCKTARAYKRSGHPALTPPP
ncbi:chitosanase, partial [Paenibacillus sp. PsM32]|nr:chitosanase [Paenibacillus sp. PsM32]